jgi:hypothetical protein
VQCVRDEDNSCLLFRLLSHVTIPQVRELAVADTAAGGVFVILSDYAR